MTWIVVGVYLVARSLFGWYAWRKLKRGGADTALWKLALLVPFGWLGVLFDRFMRELLETE